VSEQRQPGAVRVYGWQWGPDDQRRPGLPWIGIFLVVFGALLLLDRLVPEYQVASSAFLLAVGLVFLARWFVERGIGSLYAGAIIIGLAAPGVLEGLNLASGDGLGTFCLGIAFLFLAVVRYASSGGIGWQAWVGGILTLYGLARVTTPEIGQLVVPALLVILGVLLLVRGFGRTETRRL
jgi:hypothetical protein